MTRVFRVRTEIRRQLRRPRTAWTFALVVLLPVIAVLAFEFGTDDQTRSTGLIGLATASAANFAVFMVLVSASFLFVVIVALFCGDTVAADAAAGSLRYLLAAPVPRSRLLAVKLTVGLLLSLVALVVLGLVSLGVGTLAFGWHPFQTLSGDDVGAWTALLRLAGSIGYCAIVLLTTAAIAFFLSVSTDAPLGAVGGAVMVAVLSGILDQITALGRLRSLLPMHYETAFLGLLSSPVQTDDMVRGTISAVIYAVVFLSLAWWRFGRRDITS
jgi:ABC-2 type transport system permease protein